MSIEIERKFLVDINKLLYSISYKDIVGSCSIIQYYIDSVPNQTIRIRKRKEFGTTKYILGFKFSKSSMERDEIETEIDLDSARELMSHSIGYVVKRRYKINLNKLLWEIDVFSKPSNLVLGEVELKSVDQKIELPDWIIEEVTDKVGYSNYELATKES